MTEFRKLLLAFLSRHGERLFFIIATLGLCWAMWQVESLRGEASTAIVMVLGILVNKIRSPSGGDRE